MNFNFKVTNLADAGVGRVNVAFQQIAPEGDVQLMGASSLNLNLSAEAAQKEGFFPGAEYQMSITKSATKA